MKQKREPRNRATHLNTVNWPLTKEQKAIIQWSKDSLSFNTYLFIWAVLALHCCVAFPVVAASGGHPPAAVHGSLTAAASPAAEHRLSGACVSVTVAPGLWSTGSVIVTHTPGYCTAHGIFLDQGSNPCLLHSQVDSLPPSHQGSSSLLFL